MTPQREDFRYAETLRVRWAEVDLQQIVFNGHYLMYFDTAMAGFWRALALPYPEGFARWQGDLYVRKATVDYEVSARYDDRLDVGLRCTRLGNSSLNFTAAVFRDGRCLVHGELVYVFADPATQTSRPLPAELRAWLQAHEAGEAMLSFATGDALALSSELATLSLVADAVDLLMTAGPVGDPNARYAVARNRLGLAVAAARLPGARDGFLQIDDLRVLPALRGSGIGLALVDAIGELARNEGAAGLRADAAPAALPFLRRAGFVDQGSDFDRDGQRLQPMLRASPVKGQR